MTSNPKHNWTVYNAEGKLDATHKDVIGVLVQDNGLLQLFTEIEGYEDGYAVAMYAPGHWGKAFRRGVSH